jgi:hypothetical protein
MQNSSKIQKPKSLSRSALRRNRSLKILRSGRLSDTPCDRCRRRNLRCLIMEDNRCSECVCSGVEGSCDAEGCIDKQLAEAKAELREVMERMTVLLKRVADLEERSRKEYDDLMEGIEDESNESESSSDSENGNMRASSSSGSGRSMVSVGTETDPLSMEAWAGLPTVGDSDCLGEIFE